MTNTEAREIFNAAIANETDADRIAKVELLREYFTNPEFRAAMADEVYGFLGSVPAEESDEEFCKRIEDMS